jgi:hypothetical protein
MPFSQRSNGTEPSSRSSWQLVPALPWRSHLRSTALTFYKTH